MSREEKDKARPELEPHLSKDIKWFHDPGLRFLLDNFRVRPYTPPNDYNMIIL